MQFKKTSTISQIQVQYTGRNTHTFYNLYWQINNIAKKNFSVNNFEGVLFTAMSVLLWGNKVSGKKFRFRQPDMKRSVICTIISFENIVVHM